MKFDQWLSKKCLLKTFLFWSFGGPPVQLSKTIYAILKEGIRGNIHVKLYKIWISGSGGDVIYRHFYLELWQPLRPMVQEEMAFKGISYLELWQLFCSAECNSLCILVEGIMRNNSV